MGMEEQLLALVVQKERPDLQQQRYLSEHDVDC